MIPLRFFFDLNYLKIISLPKLKTTIKFLFHVHIRELGNMELKIIQSKDSIRKTLPITNMDSQDFFHKLNFNPIDSNMILIFKWF